jgi:hypothetical protein
MAKKRITRKAGTELALDHEAAKAAHKVSEPTPTSVNPTAGSVPVGLSLFDLLGRINAATLLVGVPLVALSMIPVVYLYCWLFPGLLPIRTPFSQTQNEALVVPANQLWVPTGITVKTGDMLSMRVSGSVNLASHRLLWGSLAGVKHSYGWINSSGQRVVDNARAQPREGGKVKEGALHPGAPLGSLLMYIRADGAADPSERNARPSHSPEQDYIVVQVNSAADRLGFTAPRSGTLFFVVNEVVPDEMTYFVSRDDTSQYEEEVRLLQRVDDSFRKEVAIDSFDGRTARAVGQYLGKFAGSVPKDANELIDKLELDWERNIKNYNEAWYADNIGLYLVQIEIGSE